MQGPSRAALHASRESLDEALGGDVDAQQLAEDLLAVAGMIAGSAPLRRAMSDPSREGKDRVGLADRLLTGRIGESAHGVTRTAVSQRWSESVDLSTALEELGVEALLAHAERRDRLGRVEDELFRFHRIVTGDPRLQAALTDRRAPTSSKVALVDSLLAEQAAPETVRLVTHAVGSSTARFGQALESYLDIAARRQNQVTAVITTASALTEEQISRILQALSTQYQRNVHANVVIDPSVLGGVRIDIGDEIIEGTVRSRLEDARRYLSR